MHDTASAMNWKAREPIEVPCPRLDAGFERKYKGLVGTVGVPASSNRVPPDYRPTSAVSRVADGVSEGVRHTRYCPQTVNFSKCLICEIRNIQRGM